MTSRKQLANQDGAVLLMLLVIVSLMGLTAGIAGSSWQTIVQRSREQDLLWKGNQIRTAIEAYYQAPKAGGKTLKMFPPQLEDLLKDPRSLATVRYLRKVYPDPMTGEDWDIIAAPGGGVMGVRSGSDKKPFKQTGFSESNKSFSGKQSYREWEFVYSPPEKVQTKVKISVNSNSTTN